MKKIIIISVALVLFGSMVFAQGQQGPNDSAIGTMNLEQSQQGQQVQTQQQTQNQAEENKLMITQQQQLVLDKVEAVHQLIQQKQQEMNQEIEALEKTEQKIYQNQNQVRLAVHSLLAMEELTEGIGLRVSQIAQEFNNSVQATIKAEEKIETRNQVVRFFAGGDKEAARLIEEEITRNIERIRELNHLRENCDCDEPVKVMFREQVENILQEQNRLQQLAQGEKEHPWLLGRFFGWLGRLF